MLLLLMILNLSESLTYQITSSTSFPISCTSSGSGNTVNTSAYSSFNTLSGASWVWISNSAVNSDTCTIGFTFEYLLGSIVSFSFKSADDSYIYVNGVSLYSSQIRSGNKNINSFFSTTGSYSISIVVLHNVDSFGFSFILSETYNCPPNCNQCSSPTTCLSCETNANGQTTSCSCSGGTCTLQTNPFITLDLSVTQDQVTDTSSGIIFETGTDTNFFLTGTSSDPIPAYQRGYYFTSTSYMSSTSFILPFEYTMIFYIKHKTSGILLSKNSLEITTQSTVSYIITSIITASFSAVTNTNWMVMAFTVWINSDSQINCMLTYPPSSGTTITAAQNIYTDTSSPLVLGSPSGSFVGFIYKFVIYTGIQSVSAFSVTICTSLSSNCLWNCDFNSYFDGNSCVSCLNLCTADCPSSCTKGCRRGTDCGLNDDKICGDYSTYTTCTTCLTNANFNSGVCECITKYYWSSTQCDPCDITCQTCSGALSNQCLSCPVFSLLSTNQCNCITYYYWNVNQCSPCYSLCYACSGSSVICSQCLSSAFLLSQVCLASCPTLYNSNTGTCVNSGTLLLKYNFYQFDSVFTDAENLLSFTGTNVQFGAFREA